MSERKPGRWPVDEPTELNAVEPSDVQGAQHLGLTAVQARFHVTLGAIRGDLEEQPSPMCVRTAARRWCDEITAMANEITQQPRDTG
ncbi:hypothetical protein [Streptomyces sp. NPDC002994]|uniref:hypothetical protein n=1 Tax=Streptomyces sp. NPDC002994 TaxID=3154441 RepID=UPI0033B0DA69